MDDPAVQRHNGRQPARWAGVGRQRCPRPSVPVLAGRPFVPVLGGRPSVPVLGRATVCLSPTLLSAIFCPCLGNSVLPGCFQLALPQCVPQSFEPRAIFTLKKQNLKAKTIASYLSLDSPRPRPPCEFVVPVSLNHSQPSVLDKRRVRVIFHGEAALRPCHLAYPTTGTLLPSCRRRSVVLNFQICALVCASAMGVCFAISEKMWNHCQYAQQRWWRS